MNDKRCSLCNEVKSIGYFSKKKASKDGFQTRCKECCRTLNLFYREKNKESLKVKAKIYQEKNKDIISAKMRLYHKEYYKNHKQKIKLYRAGRIEETRKWKEQYKERRRELRKYKFENDINYRILDSLRARLNKAITRGKKSDSTINLTGCTLEELKIHIERQFKKGMDWSNYGLYGWHIDHIIPCASFDLSDPEQQKECFNFMNLQPLWAKDNISKSDKILSWF